MKVEGHKLHIEWNGERAVGERANTGRCICGWEEICSSQAEVRREYRMHLLDAKKELLATYQRLCWTK